MLRDWRAFVKKLVLLLAVLVLIGLLSGKLLLVLCIGLTIFVCHTLYQLRRLHLWLHPGGTLQTGEPPEGRGLWGDIFDGIYQLQRREREASEHLASIINKAQQSTAALDIAVIMINSKANLEWWNPAAERLLGFDRDKDYHQPITNLVREPEFLDYFQREHYEKPLKLSSPITKGIVLEFQITLFGEGERLLLIRDITQLHRLETMRRDFIGNVSHELRTPITVITGYLETLLDNRESIAGRWIKPLEQMYQQSQRMENIIRDLLTLSQLETRSLSRERTAINVLSLLQEIREDAEQLFVDKNHQYEVECPQDCLLQGNLNELYSAVSNLVFNAAKYTPDGGHIRLLCYTDKQGLAIEVADDGPGIEAQHIPRITERFYRIDESRSTDTGGTGLGLAIVKHVLARHSATLEIQSRLQQGSRFVCHFPKERILAGSTPQTGAERTR